MTFAQLDVQPVLLRRRVVHRVLGVGKEARPRHVPLVRGEQKDVGARQVHLVRLSRVNRLLLDSFDLQRVQLLIEYLKKEQKKIKRKYMEKGKTNLESPARLAVGKGQPPA